MYEAGIDVTYRLRDSASADFLPGTYATVHLPGWCAGDPQMAVALHFFGSRTYVDDVEVESWEETEPRSYASGVDADVLLRTPIPPAATIHAKPAVNVVVEAMEQTSHEAFAEPDEALDAAYLMRRVVRKAAQELIDVHGITGIDVYDRVPGWISLIRLAFPTWRDEESPFYGRYYT